MLSWHVQKFVAIWFPTMELHLNQFSIEFELQWKRRSWNGPLGPFSVSDEAMPRSVGEDFTPSLIGRDPAQSYLGNGSWGPFHERFSIEIQIWWKIYSAVIQDVAKWPLFCSDMILYNGVTLKLTFRQIWISVEKSFVKWAPDQLTFIDNKRSLSYWHYPKKLGWKLTNIHITPNSKRWDYSDIPWGCT